MTGTFENRALRRLRDGSGVSAVWLSLGSTALAEIAAESSPDAIVFDGQHGLWERAALHAAIAAAGDCTPLVRVQANSVAAIGEALDHGAQGIIVPLVGTAAEAEAAVAAAHYPPRGCRSGGGLRPLGAIGPYVAACATQVLVSVMIETRDGLANAAAIAATPGIDLVFIGPGDLALQLGPEADLEAAIQQVLAECRSAGVPCGLFTGSAEAARDRLRQGFAFVVADDDIRLARGGIASSLATVRQDAR